MKWLYDRIEVLTLLLGCTILLIVIKFLKMCSHLLDIELNKPTKVALVALAILTTLKVIL